MKPTTSTEDSETIDDVPESPLLKVLRPSRYGSVPDLDDEELADPDELEEQVYREEFEPILTLPIKAKKGGIRPDYDESGKVDFGAFATVDFERMYGGFDKARYKADKLREELRDVVILVEIVNERIPGKAKYRVLGLVRKGKLELEDIVHEDMRALARLYLRALKLRQQITQLKEQSWKRRLARARAILGEE
jgi:hypothetical protein